MKRSLVSPLLLVITATASACGGGAKITLSETEFAHGQPSRILGSPQGRIEALKTGFATDFTNVKVCVEVGKAISEPELFLEAKLAIAMWLGKAGTYSNADFARLSFEGQSKCKKDDRNFAAAIVLADFAKEAEGDDFKGQFNEPKITCQRTGGSASCRGTGMTLGWGGTGSIGSSYFASNPQRWVKIVNGQPSSVLLSPYTKFTSLKSDFVINTKLATAQRTDLMTRYDALLASAAPSLDELVSFGDVLARYEVLTTGDKGFNAAFQDFLNGTQTAWTSGYQPEMAAFHVLLHEVGHMFGMEHADNPNTDSITGNTSGAMQRSDGKWETNLSAMAYALPYAYLTEDDRAGIASAGSGLRAELALHH